MIFYKFVVLYKYLLKNIWKENEKFSHLIHT